MPYTSDLQAYKLTVTYRTGSESGCSNASHLRCGHFDDTARLQHLRSSLCTTQALAPYLYRSMLSLYALGHDRSMLAVEILPTSPLYFKPRALVLSVSESQ